MTTSDKIFTDMEDLIRFAKQKGASDADVKIGVDKAFSFGTRLGKPEKIERSESNSITIRLFQGKKKQTISASNLNTDILKQSIKNALVTIGELPDDPYCGLATQDQITRTIPILDIADVQDPPEETLMEIALAAENMALETKGITNSEGGSIGWDRHHFYMLSSNGFKGDYETTSCGFHVEPVAGTGEKMQVSYDFSSAVYFKDIKSPQEVGRKAAEKALAKLNPKKIKTGEYPVVYHADIGGSLLGLMMEAINGNNIAKGVSFLKEKKGQRIFPENIQIFDNPHLSRGQGSRPFDSEGFGLSTIQLVKDGILQQWMMDLISARKMKLEDDTSILLRGSSMRTNLYMASGQVGFEDMLADIKEGFLVTELMSRPDTLANGDYSVGASGFMIEKGRITHAVHEATLSANLMDMFQSMVPADDLVIDRTTKTPSLFIPKMTVAGS